MPRIKWTKEKLQQEANKFDTRNEFRKLSQSAYITARSRGILDNICSNMEGP